MAYWIHENGETIGPLKAIEILERAQPETLVSHGQEWIPLGKHPDFSFQAVQSAPSIPGTACSDAIDRTAIPRQSAALEETPGIAHDPSWSPEFLLGGVSTQSHAKARPAKTVRNGEENQTTAIWGGVPNAQVRGTSSAHKGHAQFNASKEKTKIRIHLAAVFVFLSFLAVGIIALLLQSRSNTTTASVDAGETVGTPARVAALHPSKSQENARPDGAATIGEKKESTNERMRTLEAELAPLKAKYDEIAQQYPSFFVSGEIVDRGEDWVTIVGFAIPSNKDLGHVGTVPSQGAIHVSNVPYFNNPQVFTHERVYFVKRDTAKNQYGGPMPITVFSTKPPKKYHKAEKRMSELDAKMEPLRNELITLAIEKLGFRDKQQEGVTRVDSWSSSESGL